MTWLRGWRERREERKALREWKKPVDPTDFCMVMGCPDRWSVATSGWRVCWQHWDERGKAWDCE